MPTGSKFQSAYSAGKTKPQSGGKAPAGGERVAERMGDQSPLARSKFVSAYREGERARLPMPEKTWADAWKEYDWKRSVPFLGSGVEAVDMYDLWDASRRLEEGTATKADRERLTAFLDDAAREKSVGYMAASIIAELPAFIGEMAVGGMAFQKAALKGALGKGIRETVEAAAAKAAKAAVLKSAEKGLLARGAVVVARAAAQTAAMPQRVVAETYRRAMPEFGMTEQDGQRFAFALAGTSREFWEALPQGAADTFIEAFSEGTGGAIAKLPPISWVNAAQAAVARKWMQRAIERGVDPADVVDTFVDKVLRYGQWDGVLAEMGEERVGDVMRAATGLQSWGDVLPTAKQLAAEFIAFQVPGAGAALADKALGGAKAPAKPQDATAGAEAQKPQEPYTGTPEARAVAQPTTEEDAAVWERLKSKINTVRAARGDESEAELSLFEPTSEGEKWAADIAARDGVKVYVFNGGTAAPAGYYRGRAIFLNASIPDEAKKRWVAVHEMVHSLRDVDEPRLDRLLERLKKIDPVRFREEVVTQVHARHRAGLGGMSEKVGQEEAGANLAEKLGNLVIAMAENPAVVQEALSRAPSLGERILDAIARFLNKLPGISVRDSAYRRLARLRVQLGGDRSGIKSPRVAFAMAEAIRDAVISAAGTKPLPVDPTYNMTDDATTPQAIDVKVNGRRVRVRVKTRGDAGKIVVSDVVAADTQQGGAELATPLELGIPRKRYESEAQARREVFREIGRQFPLWDVRAPESEEPPPAPARQVGPLLLGPGPAAEQEEAEEEPVDDEPPAAPPAPAPKDDFDADLDEVFGKEEEPEGEQAAKAVDRELGRAFGPLPEAESMPPSKWIELAWTRLASVPSDDGRRQVAPSEASIREIMGRIQKSAQAFGGDVKHERKAEPALKRGEHDRDTEEWLVTTEEGGVYQFVRSLQMDGTFRFDYQRLGAAQSPQITERRGIEEDKAKFAREQFGDVAYVAYAASKLEVYSTDGPIRLRSGAKTAEHVWALVRKYAAEVGWNEADPLDRKKMQEAFEGAASVWVSDSVAALRHPYIHWGRGSGDRKHNVAAAWNWLVDFDRGMPKLDVRTGDSKLRQAYSTPIPLAYLAGSVAGRQRLLVEGGFGKGADVYEPTAGTGLLTMAFNQVQMNELDPTRANILRALHSPGLVTQRDAMENVPERAPNVIVANPPFGTVPGPDGLPKVFVTPGFETTQIDQAILLRALSQGAKNVAGVFIIGGHQDMRSKEGGRGTERESFYRAAAQTRFFRHLYDTYNVVDHFTVSGKLYQKMGAAWPVDVIVISGRGASKLARPYAVAPKVFETWDELERIFNGERSLVEPHNPPKIPGLGPNSGSKKRPPTRRVGGGDRTPRGGDGDAGAGSVDGGGATGGATGTAGGPSGSPGVDSGAPAGAGGAGEGAGRGGAEGRDDSGGDVRPGGGGSADQPADLDRPRDDVTPPLDVIVETPPAPQEIPEPPLVEPEPPPAPPAREQPPAPKGDVWDELKGAIDDLFSLGDQAEQQPLDETKYQKLSALLRRAVESIDAALRTTARDIQRIAIRALQAAGLTREKVKAVQPYIVRFSNDYVSEQAASSDAKQVPYRPKSRANPAGSLLPANTAANVQTSLDELEQRIGNVDEYVLREMGWPRDRILGDKGVLTAEQVDALANAIEKAKNGGGFVLGDQTGVGKGRVVASMIVWAIRHGKIPVFVTEKPTLYVAMRADLRDIGHRDVTPLVTNADVKLPPPEDEAPEDRSLETRSLAPVPYEAALRKLREEGALPAGFNVVFTTYDQMKREAIRDAYGKVTGAREAVRHEAMRAIAARALFLLDEAHNAGGQKETGRKKRVDVSQSRFFRDLLNLSAGALYSSATWAKNADVMSLYAKTSMARAFNTTQDMVATFSKGGVPLLQIVSTMLARAGEYMRRERSYEGIAIEVEPALVDVDTANTAQEVMRRISALDMKLDGARKAFGELLGGGGKKRGADAGVGRIGTNAVFSSVMWNLHAQLLLALKAPAVADAMIASHKRGEKPIVTLSHTMGTHLEDFMASENLKVGDDVTEIYGFGFMFERYLTRIRQVMVKEHNEKRYVTLPDEFLESFGVLEEWKALASFARAADFSKIPASPIDYMIDRLESAGLRVGEITGRGLRLQTKTAPDGSKRLVIANRSTAAAAKQNTIKWFNSAKGERTVDATGATVYNPAKILDALVINRSGAAGISLHASEKWGTKEEQKPRHMFIAQFEFDTNLVMQMLGRINRHGQLLLPLYTAMVSQLPTEKRPCAMLINKLASLNANTNAARGGSMGLLDVVDFANVYGDQVVSEFLRNNPEYTNQFDLAKKLANANPEGTAPDIASTFTGRLVVLQVEEQERILKQIEEEFLEVLDQAKARGENKLEAQIMDLDARAVEDTVYMEKSDDSGSPFTKEVRAVRYDVKRLVKPMTLAQVAEEIRTGLGVERDDQVPFAARKAMAGLAQEIGKARAEELARLAARRAELEPELATAMARVDAAKQRVKEVAGTEEEEKAQAALLRATARVEALNEELHVADERKIVTEQSASRIHSMLLEYPPGKNVTLTAHQDNEAGDVQLGQIVSIKRLGKAKSALSASDYVVRIVTTESSAPIAFRISQLNNVVKLGAMPDGTFAPALQRAHGMGREQRWMMTGNIPRAYSDVRRFGRIVFFRDNTGEVEPGVLMPAAWDPQTAANTTPVTMSAEEAWEVARRAGVHVGSFIAGADRPVTDGSGPVVIVPPGDPKGDIATPGLNKTVLRNAEVKAHLQGGDWVRVQRTKLYAARFLEEDRNAHALAALKELEDDLGLTWYVIRPDGKDWLKRIRAQRENAKDDEGRMSLTALDGDVAETWLARQVNRWADAFAPIRRLYARLAADGQVVADPDNAADRETLRRGRTKAAMDELERTYLDPIKAAMREGGLDMEYVDAFLQARHAQERNATIRARTTRVDAEGNVTNPDEIMDAGSGWTDAEAAEWLAKASQDPRWAHLQKVAALFDAMNAATRQRWLETGLESRATVDGLAAQWKAYAPLRTDMDKEARRLAQGFGVSIGGKEFVAATGRNSKADYTLAFGFAQAQSAIIRGEKNLVAQAFMRTVAKHLNPTAVRVHKRKMRRKLGKDGTVRMVPDPTFRLRANVVEVKIKGKTRYMEFAPNYQSWATALKGSSSEYGGKVTEAARRFTRILANMSTRWNPVFPLFNAIRDTGTAALHMTGEQGAPFAVAVLRDNPRAFAAMRWAALNPGAKPRNTWEEWARLYIESGGPVSGYYGGDVREIVQDVQRHMADLNGRRKSLASVRRLLDWMAAHNDAVENASRLSFFVHAQLDLGWSAQRAAVGAKELTVNFERRGELGAVMNAWWMFSNAGVQSMFRGAAAWKHKGIRRLLLGAVLGAATWDLVARAIGGDDEDGIPFYDKIPDWEKRTNLILMLPGTNGDYVSLPAPFVYSWFQTLGMNLGAIASGRRDVSEAALSVGASLLDNFNPLGGAADPIEIIVPTPLDPIAQITRNRDWAGRTIAPAQLPWGAPKPDAENYWPDVNPTVKAVTSFLAEATGGDAVRAGVVDVSPETVEHLIGFYSGGLGKTLGRLFDVGEKAAMPGREVEIRDIPLLQRLYREISPRWGEQHFRENVDLVERAQRRVKSYLAKGDRPGAIKAAKQEAVWLQAAKVVKLGEKRVRALEDQVRAGGPRASLAEADQNRIMRIVNAKVEQMLQGAGA